MNFNGKNTGFLIVILLSFAVLISGCVSDRINNTSAIGLTNIDDFTITEISVMNGMSGDSGIIEDRTTIEKLISLLDQYPLERMDDQMDLNGFRYSLDFYSEAEKVSRITIVGEDIVNVDGVYYEVNGTPIDITYVQELIESAIILDENTAKKTNLRMSSLINNSSEITKISMRNGFSQELSVLENTTKIEELISDLDGYPLEEFPGDFLFNGYQYDIYFYTDSGHASQARTMGSNMDNLVQVNGVLYEIAGPSVDLKEFEDFTSSNSTLTSGNEGLNVEISGIMEALSIEDLVSQSDIIIAGTVTGAYPSRWNTRGGQKPDKSNDELDIGTEDMIYTDIGVYVNKYLKNPLDCLYLQITIEGGTVGNDSIWVEDSPSFEYGENILLFLNWKSGRDEMTVTGGYQGKFTMINDTTAVRDDGVSVSITEFYDHWEITEI